MGFVLNRQTKREYLTNDVFSDSPPCTCGAFPLSIYREGGMSDLSGIGVSKIKCDIKLVL